MANQKMDFNVSYLNERLDYFISQVFKAICEELSLKEKVLVAKNKKYFYDERSYNLFSRIYRRIYPNTWSYSVQSTQDKHTIEPVENSKVKIFPQGKPLVSEIQQSDVGDCYLMSSLIALAKNNPECIKKCFVQDLATIENKNKIDIRFFQKVYSNSKVKAVPITITIDKKRVISPRGIKGNALWPKLIEKAYAIYQKETYDSFNSTTNVGLKLDGGSPNEVMFAITGKKAKTSLTDLKVKRENIISKIKTKLQKSRSLVCSFMGQFTIKDSKSGEKITIYPVHAYAIVGIDEVKGYVRLINPWKSEGREEHNSPKSKEGGHIAISFDDFKKHLLEASYTTGKSCL